MHVFLKKGLKRIPGYQQQWLHFILNFIISFNFKIVMHYDHYDQEKRTDS